MSQDQWEVYMSQMGDFPCAILFNDALSERLEDCGFAHALRLRIPLKDRGPHGLRSEVEFDPISRLEDALEREVVALGGVFLGHIIWDGHYHLNYLVAEGLEPYHALCQRLAIEHQYEIQLAHDADPEHKAYWDELYPTATDRQVMQDNKVLEELLEHGDDGSIIRPIEHWAYFHDAASRAEFSVFIEAAGYALGAQVEMRDASDGGPPDLPFPLRFSREDRPGEQDFTNANILLLQKALELGGVYDGWETVIVKH